MARIPLILHERLATWARHIRPRVAAWPVRVIESRSADDLAAAFRRSACPIALIDLGNRPKVGLDDLDRALPAAPNALILVLDPGSLAGVSLLARELGASHVFSGVVTPPTVVDLLARWLLIARERAQADGWAGDLEPEPEPWESLATSSFEIAGR